MHKVHGKAIDLQEISIVYEINGFYLWNELCLSMNGDFSHYGSVFGCLLIKKFKLNLYLYFLTHRYIYQMTG